MAKLPSDNPPRVLATKATPTGCIQLILRAHFSGACGDKPVSVDMKRLPERLFGLICYPENNYGEAAAKGIADALNDAIVRAVSSEAKPRGAVRELMTVDMLDSRLLVGLTKEGGVTALRVSNPGFGDRVIETVEDVLGRSLWSPRPAT